MLKQCKNMNEKEITRKIESFNFSVLCMRNFFYSNHALTKSKNVKFSILKKKIVTKRDLSVKTLIINSKTFEKNISMHQFILCSLMSLAWPPSFIQMTLI